MAYRVLVVDDALFMRTTLRKILEQSGFAVAGEAETGSEAVQLYTELKPDVVLMDITMPVMDGIEAVRAIKRSDAAARIVMCSALGQQNLVIEALRAGAADYIVKPFDASRVVEGISKAAGCSRAA